jgi:hypothetical protein
MMNPACKNSYSRSVIPHPEPSSKLATIEDSWLFRTSLRLGVLGSFFLPPFY